MQITNKELKKWKFLSEHGDYKAIAESFEQPDYRKVSDAFKTKECSEEVYRAIKAFYDKREKRVNQG
jgi:hypothetical protein